ncbi:Uncharacterised protein [Streptococcus pyogenes]|nr:Uncharacterised protein [Streptococcus pyogenes]VGR93788.1 Uncharacterised protein [Streptococcus pyogenes]VGS10339.1 Uncharacterised protein [Streptococcus pyogenes]VGS45402.1 Uncharacterised protein [Streptococcus pyogenes]VGT59345.1 Uncharacterised protein [Streptococcus pyogenes]
MSPAVLRVVYARLHAAYQGLPLAVLVVAYILRKDR